MLSYLTEKVWEGTEVYFRIAGKTPSIENHQSALKTSSQFGAGVRLSITRQIRGE